MEKIPANNHNRSMIKLERAAYMLAVLFLSFMLIKEAVYRTEYQLDAENLLIENQQLKKDILDDSSKIYSMSKQLADAELINQTQKETIELLELRKPTEIVKWKTKTILSASIPIAEPVKFDSSLYLPLPTKFSKYNRWYTINGEITSKGILQIDSLVNYANFTYAVGDTMRKGLINRVLGKKDKVVRLHLDNPNIEVVGMQNIYLHERKRWYETTAFKVGAGFVLGATIIGVSK